MAPGQGLAIDQGRDTVLAWQRTVDAAWERQAGLLTAPGGPVAGPGAGGLDAARRQFFGPAAPGDERRILQTNAKVPGGKDGIIVSRFYIADELAAFGNLRGDGRGPTTDPKAGHRFSVAWDTATGEVSLTVNHSSIVGGTLLAGGDGPILVPEQLNDREVGAWPINLDPGGKPNNFVLDAAAPDHLKVSYNVLNSGIPVRVGEANGWVDIKLDPNNIYVNLHGDHYPDGEFIQYRTDDTRMLATKPMSPHKELAVFPDIDQLDRFWPVPR